MKTFVLVGEWVGFIGQSKYLEMLNANESRMGR